MLFVPGSITGVLVCDPFGLFKIVTPRPDPRSVMGLCSNKRLFTIKVPGLSLTTCPEGQLSSFAWIAAESSLPLGESVAQMVVRLGIPPLDIIPGFQVKFLSAGMIDCAAVTGAVAALVAGVLGPERFVAVTEMVRVFPT